MSYWADLLVNNTVELWCLGRHLYEVGDKRQSYGGRCRRGKLMHHLTHQIKTTTQKNGEQNTCGVWGVWGCSFFHEMYRKYLTVHEMFFVLRSFNFLSELRNEKNACPGLWVMAYETITFKCHWKLQRLCCNIFCSIHTSFYFILFGTIWINLIDLIWFDLIWVIWLDLVELGSE